MLEIRNLYVTLPSTVRTVAAVNGVSLTIDRGEIVGIVGESGAGKTMLARAITGLLPAHATTKGEVVFDGVDVLRMNAGQLRAHRGAGAAMCFQNPRRALAPVRTVGGQIDDRLEAHRHGDLEAHTPVGLLEAVGIRDARRRLHAYPHELSGGMAQRVMISLALACWPSLLVADEPTTGLDVTLTRGILDLLATTTAEGERALLVISHDIAAIARICRRIVVMYGGIVVEEGPTDVVLGHPGHPYTAALLDSVPDVATGPRRALPGLMPQFGRPPESCPFAPRCALAEPRCLEGVPPTRDLGDGWSAACIHAGDDRVGSGGLPMAADTARNAAADDPLVEVRDLEVVYGARFGRGGHHALRGVTLAVRSGETLGVVGESGSGKTTLARTLLGLTRPAAGVVLFEGQDTRGLSAGSLRKLRLRMQMVFQDPIDTLDPRRTVRQTLHDSLRLLDGRDGDADAMISRVLEQVALDPSILDSRRHELSGGQAQRVGIARALIMDPHLIVFDEPTSALDVTVQAQILELIQSLMEERSRAYVYVSHDLATVRYIADRVIVLYLGKVVEAGTAETVFSQPLHPYTRALFAGIPTLRAHALATQAPVELRRDLDEHVDLTGCPLASRCPFVTDRCVAEPQPLREYGTDHAAACWRIPEIR
jgi:oligopeptide/dipeptide ABC transporter ATP-binding protein